jgi:ArsR family transcriptional regulator, arsenate/arsenite/antimonite-responsive transcriptional repressor
MEGSSMERINNPPVEIEKLASLLKVLSEPRRLNIIHHLMEGVQCNCELGDVLQMAPNLISHHLSVLRESGLVEAERDPVDGRWIYYSINKKALEDLNQAFGLYFDPDRIKPRRKVCGPKSGSKSAEQLIIIDTRQQPV